MNETEYYRRKTKRCIRYMMFFQHVAAYFTSRANFYATLCNNENWKTPEEIVAEFRQEIEEYNQEE